MKTIIITMLCLLVFGACSSNSSLEEGIFLYQTSVYDEHVKNLEISLEDAEQIVCKAMKNKSLASQNFVHYLIYKDDYVFIRFSPKHSGLYEINQGAFVNVHTGTLVQNKYKGRKVSILTGKQYLISCLRKNKKEAV